MEESMEQQEDSSLKGYWVYVKNNKYSFFFIGSIIILLFIATSMIIYTMRGFNGNTITQPTTISNQSQSVSRAQVSITASPSQSAEAVITPDQAQSIIIKDQTQPQIASLVSVPYIIASINQYGNNWGTMTLVNPNANIGAVIIKKENGKWKVIEGPGTFFPKQILESIGAPQSLINVFFPPISPSPAL